ncbi:WecB/TagA/CpsF family glycosyltransferase [Flagellimonas sp. GZD32]|uniref:WecB/TagA/CpsF family glycosyltransferase n=1 Tax=Flagellimonas cixiensis TaxID=3228750 RepID=UPI0035C8F1FF
MGQIKRELFGLEINNISKSQLISELLRFAQARRPSYLCAVNVHMLVEAQTDISLKKAIKNAQWAVTDGVPVKWAFSYFNKVSQSRIAGMDITPELIEHCDEKQMTVSVFGNTEENLDIFQEYLTQNFGNVKIGRFISPPFRKLTVEETEKYVHEINDVGTNILFVSLGCPKQEKWMLENSSDLSCVCLGIGNAINTVIGSEKRPPKFIQKLGMEWFYRLIQNPTRLFNRYFYTNSKFIALVLKRIISR